MATAKMIFNDENSSCDLYINGEGKVEIISENKEIAQSLKDELESNMKQWYLGYYWGLKMLQDDGSGIFDRKNITDDEIQQEFQRVISKNKNIYNTNFTKIERNDRHMYIEIEIKTKYGTEQLSISLIS